MFRTSHIRSKLAVALAVPLVALMTVAGFEVYVAGQALDETRSEATLATSAIGPSSLVVRLQDERNRASIDLIGLGAAAGLPVATNAEARALTDTAVTDLQAELAGRGAEVADAFAPAWEALGALEALRGEIDAYAGPMDLSNDEFANDVFSRYTAIIEAYFDATSTVALSVDASELRNGVEIVDAAIRASEIRARLVRSIVLATVTGTTSAPATGQDVAALMDRGRGYDDTIRANATGPYEGIGDATFTEPGVQSFNRQVEAFLAGEDVSITDLLGAVKSQPDIGYLGLRSRTAEVLTSEAVRIEDEAVTRQQAFALIALASIVIAVLATWLASRSITRPLRVLRQKAEHMAQSSLPAAVRQILDTPPGEDVVIPEVEPIEIKSRDEVAQVAAALSAVQSSAVDLAVEQAVLRRNISDSYINLGRRNQNLLSRQLDFITELERNEADPDTLEGLFRLDHLATRMRRNAESLLVLAGIEPPRQWSAPVKASDVVRAALGEVEDYQRVVVRHLEPAAVTGAVAADVAHVLAELIENALSFSPPEQSVEVKGRLTPDGYTVAISDNGLGMAPADLERANRRLAGKESFTVAPSRYLGHYVAGHLASRLGVVVELQDSPAGGITARVDVPMGLLANEETDPRLAGIGTVDVEGSRPEPSVITAAAAQPEADGFDWSAPFPAAGAGDEPTPSVSSGVSTSTTASGLPRRGERPAPEPVAEAPAADLEPAADRPEWDSAPPAHASMADPVWSPDLAPEPVWAPEPVAAVEPVVPVSPPEPVTRPEVAPAPAWGESFDTQSIPVRPDRPVDPIEVEAPAPLMARDGAEDTSTAPRSLASSPLGDPAAQPTGLPPLGGRGFGGLAVTRPMGSSMYSVAANNARAAKLDGSVTEITPTATTQTGLTRRVPGAQRPDVGLGREAEVAPTPEPVRTTPEDVYSFLSSFQSGVARGRADAHADSSAETMEDGR